MSDVKINEEVTKEEQDKNGKHKESSSKKVQKESKQLKDLKAQVDKLEKQLAGAETETLKLKDQLLRKMAEFDNYKRRTEKEFIDKGNANYPNIRFIR